MIFVWSPFLRSTIRDAFREMLDSVVANGHTFEECKEILKQSAFRLSFSRPITVRARLLGISPKPLPHLFCVALVLTTGGVICADIKLDPGFREFYRYCRSNDIPVVIVSR